MAGAERLAFRPPSRFTTLRPVARAADQNRPSITCRMPQNEIAQTSVRT
jgi:hypothetical protein